MKKINVEDSVGKKLCHDITAITDDFKGIAFKRGHIITEDDIPKLLDLGKHKLYIWEDNVGDIHEEDAAKRLSAMSISKHMYPTDVAEGKIVHKSEVDGMFRVDKELLKDINMIGDISITTVPDKYPVVKGDSTVSMRIIPLVTKEEQIEKAEELCQGRELFKIIPYKNRKVGVVITGSEIYSGRIKDKFEVVIREKLSRFPADIIGVTICDDKLEMIEKAAKKHIENGADFIIYTGGMSVDPDDITPTAIKSLGAKIITHGVPAQPGNMTMLAYLNEIAMIGVPSAAINLPMTVLDVLLPQIFTGIKFTKEELMNLGAGGLCQTCGTYNYPHCSFGRY